MSLEEIERAITKLSAEQVLALAAWLAEYQARVWDQQIEEDVAAGRLDELLAEVDVEYDEGLAKPL